MNKVLIVANDIDWVYSLRKEIIERLSADYKVIVCIPECSNNFKLDYFKSINVDFVFVNFEARNRNPLKDLAIFKRYFETIKNVDPDIILTYTIKPNIYASLAGKLLGKKTIINITGLGTGFQSNKLIEIIVKRLYSIGCKAAYHVFFQNTSNMELFINNKMIEEEKCSLLPGSGVNIERYKPSERESDDNITRFLYISRIMKEKGIEEYLKVAEDITKKYSKVEFQILGPFADEDYKEVIMNKNSDRIKYLGKSDDVRREIKKVDCIVHPTFYPEGMSNVLLEGGAMGKPLIASDIPGCREIIENGINGYLFPPKDVEGLREQIESFLMLNDDDKRQMGLASRSKIIREFDRAIVVDAYLDKIEEALEWSV